MEIASLRVVRRSPESLARELALAQDGSPRRSPGVLHEPFRPDFRLDHYEAIMTPLIIEAA
jgi:hypothetical protein